MSVASPDTAVLALVTCPDTSSAQAMAHAVVARSLAACVSIVPGITSVYRWQGTIHEDAECLLLLKTTGAQVAALQAAVLAQHPYQTPEFISLPITGGSPAYLQWLGDCCQDSPLK